MGSNRKPRGLTTDTVTALERAFAQDFGGGRMTAVAREHIRQPGERTTDYGARIARASAALSLLATARPPSWIDDEFFPFSRFIGAGDVATARARLEEILERDRVFRAALRRQRGQPTKYAHLDAAIVAAVHTGESPAEVITAAVLITGQRPTKRRTDQFLDRLKKKRRTNFVE